MNTYEVTVDSMTEQYVYEVEADSEISASYQGFDSAVADGLDRHRWYNIDVRDLS